MTVQCPVLIDNLLDGNFSFINAFSRGKKLAPHHNELRRKFFSAPKVLQVNDDLVGALKMKSFWMVNFLDVSKELSPLQTEMRQNL